MPTHTITLQESEFKLFQTIRQIELDEPIKETLIEELIRQIEQWRQTHSLAAGDLLECPPQKKQRILTAQLQTAEALYREHSDVIIREEREEREEWRRAQRSSAAYQEWVSAENDIYDEVFADEID